VDAAQRPARRERPPGSRAAEERDELAAFHSITSSARASTPGGIVKPSVPLYALAFLRSAWLNLLMEDQVQSEFSGARAYGP
jgi:hypothetical protein